MNIKSEGDDPSDITYSDSSNSYSNCKNEDKFPNLEAIKINNNTSINNIYNSQLPQSSGDTLGIKSFPDISQYLPDIQQNNPKTEIKIKCNWNTSSLIREKKQNAQIDDANQSTKIFIIKKKGRKKKSIAESNQSNSHSQYSIDNLLKKVKVMYHHFLHHLTNNIIKKEFKNKKAFLLKRINSKVTEDISIVVGLNLFDFSLKEFFSVDISSKYKLFDKEYNKRVITNILSQNAEKPEKHNLIAYFNLNYKETYSKLFLGKDTSILVKLGYYDLYFKSYPFNIALKKLSKKEGGDYIYKLSEIANSTFIEYFTKKKGRRPRQVKSYS